MDVASLIIAVRERKPLWDRKHPYYHDRTVTMGMWAEVAASLDTDPDSARAKWKGLRDTFRGELRKVNKSIANGTPCKTTNWEYFEEMNFVKDQIYSNKRCLAELYIKPASPTAEEENGNVDPLVLCKTEVVDEEDIQPTKYERTESPPRTPINNIKIPENKSPTHPVQKKAHILPTDDDYNFLMSILPQLRSLPTTRNLFVRLKIQELLYNEIVTLQEA